MSSASDSRPDTSRTSIESNRSFGHSLNGTCSRSGSYQTSQTSLTSAEHAQHQAATHAARYIRHNQNVLSRVQWFALRLAQSKLIRMEKPDKYWRDLQTCNRQDGSTASSFPYPPFFRSVSICDAKISGNPVYLHSRDAGPAHPRVLNVGTARFLNLGKADPDTMEGTRILSSCPGPSGRPEFYLEVVLPLEHVVQDCNERSNPVLVAKVCVTEQVQILARNLMTRYSAGSAAFYQSGQAIVSNAAADIDWIKASHTADRESVDLLKAIPLHDPDVVEFHRFSFDILHFHETLVILQAAEAAWQMTYASRALARKEGFDSSKPPFHAPAALAEQLSVAKTTKVGVFWGSPAVSKSMYCVPLYRQDIWACWACFLLDEDIPYFWSEPSG